MRVLRLLALSSVFAAIFVACSLDWSARGVERDEAGAPPPFFLDAPSGDANGDAGDAGEDSPSADCVALGSDLDAKRKAARACGTISGPGLCQTTVKDACNCKVVVTHAEPDTATTAYDQAVSNYLARGCDAGCDASCPVPNADTVAPASWACIQTPTDIECFP